MDYTKRTELNNKAREILADAGLDPDCIWKTQLSIDEIVLQPGLSDEDAEAVVKALANDPQSSLYRLEKGSLIGNHKRLGCRSDNRRAGTGGSGKVISPHQRRQYGKTA